MLQLRILLVISSSSNKTAWPQWLNLHRLLEICWSVDWDEICPAGVQPCSRVLPVSSVLSCYM